MAPRPELATLPVAMFVVGMAISTLPSGMLARRYGRDRAIQAGNLCGVLMGLLGSLVVVQHSFVLFCLAMELCSIPRADSNTGIEMHAIAMYLPSFFTGRPITRFGEPKMIVLGLLLTASAAAVAQAGLTVNHFWLGLVLLGLGRNFSWLGASALVLKCHAPEDGPRIQSINDFAVFGSMAVGSFLSGSLLTTFGWGWVTGAMLPPVALALLCLWWLPRTRTARAGTN